MILAIFYGVFLICFVIYCLPFLWNMINDKEKNNEKENENQEAGQS